MKKPMSNKTDEMRASMEVLFPGTAEAIEAKHCTLCDEPIGPFRNVISVEEYEISGMCQRCQDKFFGED